MSILLAIILFILIFGLGILGAFFNVLRQIFMPNKSRQENKTRTSSTQNPTGKKKKKLIEKDEGEYVDFEEV